MSKAISTKFLGPTNRLPARIRATDNDGNVGTYSIHSLDLKTQRGEDLHQTAARALAARMGWKGKLITGWIGVGRYAHVFAEQCPQCGCEFLDQPQPRLG